MTASACFMWSVQCIWCRCRIQLSI